MTHMVRVGVRELRQNLSKYLERVKEGEGFVVTERGREVARLTPSGDAESIYARLARDRGATIPTGNLLDLEPLPPTPGAMSLSEALEEQREERL